MKNLLMVENFEISGEPKISMASKSGKITDVRICIDLIMNGDRDLTIKGLCLFSPVPVKLLNLATIAAKCPGQYLG